jgi:hypothetical protein
MKCCSRRCQQLLELYSFKDMTGKKCIYSDSCYLKKVRYRESCFCRYSITQSSQEINGISYLAIFPIYKFSFFRIDSNYFTERHSRSETIKNNFKTNSYESMQCVDKKIRKNIFSEFDFFALRRLLKTKTMCSSRRRNKLIYIASIRKFLFRNLKKKMLSEQN